MMMGEGFYFDTPDSRKKDSVTFRVNPSTKKQILELAKDEGVNLSDLIRQKLGVI